MNVFFNLVLALGFFLGQLSSVLPAPMQGYKDGDQVVITADTVGVTCPGPKFLMGNCTQHEYKLKKGDTFIIQKDENGITNTLVVWYRMYGVVKTTKDGDKEYGVVWLKGKFKLKEN